MFYQIALYRGASGWSIMGILGEDLRFFAQYLGLRAFGSRVRWSRRAVVEYARQSQRRQFGRAELLIVRFA